MLFEVSPLVSIIVRTKDRPRLLGRALKSIAAQTYTPLEVIIVNDCGVDLNHDEMTELLSDIPFKYIKLENNLGRAAAANIGIENVKGKFFGFLDDDDILYSDHISALISSLQESEYLIAYADANISHISVNSDGEIEAIKSIKLFSSKDFSYTDLIVQNYIPICCPLFSKKILHHLDGFDESLDIYEDWDFLIRAAGIYPFYHVKRTTSEYVIWSDIFQVTQAKDMQVKSKAATFKIIDKNKEQIIANLKEKFKEDIIHSLLRYMRFNENLKEENQYLRKQQMGYTFADFNRFMRNCCKFYFDKYIAWRFKP